MSHAYKLLNFPADKFQFNFKADSGVYLFFEKPYFLFIFSILNPTWIAVSWVLVPCSSRVDTDVLKQHAASLFIVEVCRFRNRFSFNWIRYENNEAANISTEEGSSMLL
jgi:hypothetical protein